MKIGIEFKNLTEVPLSKHYTEFFNEHVSNYLLSKCCDMEIKPVCELIVRENAVWINSQEKIEKRTSIARVTAEINETQFNYIKENINNELKFYLCAELMVYEIK